MQTTNWVYEGMWVLKVKVISLPYIFQVLYVLCFTNVKISGERLQDQWSSCFKHRPVSLMLVKIKVYIVYRIKISICAAKKFL